MWNVMKGGGMFCCLLWSYMESSRMRRSLPEGPSKCCNTQKAPGAEGADCCLNPVYEALSNSKNHTWNVLESLKVYIRTLPPSVGFLFFFLYASSLLNLVVNEPSSRGLGIRI